MSEQERRSPVRAIRAGWRMEMPPEDVESTARMLSALPPPGARPAVELRLAAAGSDLAALRRFAERTRGMVDDGELPLQAAGLDEALHDVVRGLAELVGRLEERFGAFPERDEEGVRHIFLLDVDPERHADARWAVRLAHQANDAPEPLEPVSHMMLRAIAEDLREVERFLVALLAELKGEAEQRQLAEELVAGCAEMARAIERLLPEPGRATASTNTLSDAESMSKMTNGPWPWRFEPGSNFNALATHAHIAAGFDLALHGVDDASYDADPPLIARDLKLMLVMALDRAERAGIDLDLEDVIADARAELARWQRQRRPPRAGERAAGGSANGAR